MFGLLQWVAAAVFLAWRVHWIHAGLAMVLILWTRWVAFPLIRSLDGPYRELVLESGAPAVRGLLDAWFPQDLRQSAMERIFVPLVGLVPVVILHGKLRAWESLEAAELVCFGYAFNALVMVQVLNISDLAANRGMNFASLTYVAHFLSEFRPLAPYVGMIAWIGWLQWIPTGMLHGYRLASARKTICGEQVGPEWAFVFLWIYLWTGLGMACVFVASTESREHLYMQWVR
jgi:hypothetical protein